MKGVRRGSLGDGSDYTEGWNRDAIQGFGWRELAGSCRSSGKFAAKSLFEQVQRVLSEPGFEGFLGMAVILGVEWRS